MSYFFHVNDIILKCQSDKNHNIITISLLHLSDSVLRSFDTSSLSALVTLDFSKAFDTVNYELLTAKLHHGLCDSSVSLLRSFLSNRFQKVLVYNLSPSFSLQRLLCMLTSMLTMYCFSYLSNPLKLSVAYSLDDDLRKIIE